MNSTKLDIADIQWNYRILAITLCSNHFRYHRTLADNFRGLRPTHWLRGFRVDVCVCTPVAVDSQDESASAAKNVTVGVVSIAWRRQ